MSYVDYDVLKGNLSCIDVARDLGIVLRPDGNGQYRGTSIEPGEHHHDNAFCVTKDEWFDHTANKGGSVLDLVAYVKYGNNDSDNINEAAKYLADTYGFGYDAQYWDTRKKECDEFRAKIEKWHEALKHDERALEYLHGRGINDETIERYKIGVADVYISNTKQYEKRLSVAYLDVNRQAVYMASRKLDWATHEGSPKYHKADAKNKKFLKNQPFGLDTIPQKKAERKVLFITEGMFDTLSVAQEGYSVLSSIGGAFGKENDKKVVETARSFRRVITTYDCDNPNNLSGQRFTCKMGMKFLYSGVFFEMIPNFGEGNKDVSDFYMHDGDIAQLVDRAVNGYAFMAKFTFWENTPEPLPNSFRDLSADDKDKYLSQIKKFIRRLKTFLDDEQLGDVIDALAEFYPRKKLDKFLNPERNEVLRDMCDEFLEGKHIFFCGSIKGGSYRQYQPAGYWTRLTDAALQSDLYRHFEHKISNKDVNDLTMMIRLMDTRHSMPEFNSKRLWLFQNGVLDLTTGQLREPKPDDYLSWQVSYPYDENAQCPTFDEFMREITHNEPSRLNFLDDMLGYILYENNRLERIFVLYGEGRNGKGTLLHVIEELVRSVHVDKTNKDNQSFTSIKFSEFVKPTQLICLDGSIVNLSYELSENLNGCESEIKSISSGDTISGNRKFCDTESFTPRCKLICATNHMLKLNDDSLGMRERLMFCHFANCFSGRENVKLKEQLLLELPGIFNRMYRAYKALIERENDFGCGAIRPCIDQKDFLSEFVQTSNPVAAFWNEHKDDYLNREIKKIEIFDDFKAFCERNGKYTGDERVFFKNLKKVVSDNGINIDEIRHREGEIRPYYCRFSSPNDTQNITLDDILNDGHLELDA